jgi:pimeloyl-ACP methyl ester carboxylesterase
MSEIEHLEIAVGGGMTFRARAAGPSEGRLVLLLHGFPQTSASWVGTLEALAAAGHRAVAIDQRGYSPGARPEGVDAYALDHLVAAVLAVAYDVGGHHFDLVGHDWGGLVAWYVAGRHAERVRTLTVASTPHPLALAAGVRGELGGDQPTRSGYVDMFRSPEAEELFLGDGAVRLRGMYSALPTETADEYLRVLTEPGAMTSALNYYRATPFDAFPDPGPVTSPTLYVWSTNDMALGREAAEATAAHVAGEYRFEVLDGVSHWIPDEAPADFSRLLLDHLAAHP